VKVSCSVLVLDVVCLRFAMASRQAGAADRRVGVITIALVGVMQQQAGLATSPDMPSRVLTTIL
jgi:hypothetical protein